MLGEREASLPPAAMEAPRTDPAAALLPVILLGLRVLSERSVALAANCFPLLATASAFALFWRALPDPSTLQLIGLGGYGVFILAAITLRRSK